ncbi:MAG: DUF3810 domain-containing protein [Eubacteriales bacterium]
MYSYKGRRAFPWLSFLSLLLPLCLVILFYITRNNWKIMLWWTETILPYLAHPLGKLTALVPFSVGEFLVIALVLGIIFNSCRQIYRKIYKGYPLVNPSHIFFFLSLALWIWASMSWMWNVLYYVPTLAERSDLTIAPYPIEDLISLTEYFVQGASEYASQVSRDEEGYFNVPRSQYFTEGISLYENIEDQFPFLTMNSVRAKYLTLSYLQSYFGFTGVYIPFTGEANINVHSPSVLQPAVLAHEMAHQRLIAPELEANFLSIVACLSSENNTFLYSGYLFGLIQLSNALYPVAPDQWGEIVDQYFTPELSHDWQSNYNYWQSFQSPVEDVAKDVYDGFLKSNDQRLGIRSYGACVDLLVAYFYPSLHSV